MITHTCYLLACVLAVIAVGLWIAAGLESLREDWTREGGIER